MGIEKVLGSVGAVALAALVTFGSANAAPIPITPGGTSVLAGGNDYSFTSDAQIGTTSGSSTFNFNFVGGSFSASNDTTVNPKFQAGNPNSFSSIVVSWLEGATVLASHTFTNGEFGTTLALSLPDLTTNAATTYHLVIEWTKPALATAVFDTVVSTTPVRIETPLPPAALLFVSALAGLGFAARRRKAADRQQNA